jgi:hypothetical protein
LPLAGGPTVGNVGNGYNRPGAVNGLAGAEKLEELLAGVKLFRQKLRRAPVTELTEASHAFKIAGYLAYKWPANVVVCGRVRDQGRPVRGFAKLVPGHAIEFTGRSETSERWKAAIAFPAGSLVFPSMIRGEISSRLRSTSALKVAALVMRGEVAPEYAT